MPDLEVTSRLDRIEADLGETKTRLDRIETDLGRIETETKTRFGILTWAVGILAAVVIAMVGTTINMAYQLGQVSGQLTVLISHLKS